MGITWDPIESIPALKGEALYITAGHPDHWLSCVKGEPIINGQIKSTHTNQVSAVVSHTCSPQAPAGLIITNDNANGGISITGTVNEILVTPTDITYSLDGAVNNSSEEAIPEGGILTHYVPGQTERILFTVSVKVIWTHIPDVTPIQTEYNKDWKIGLYNRWVAEKNTVLSLIER